MFHVTLSGSDPLEIIAASVLASAALDHKDANYRTNKLSHGEVIRKKKFSS